MRKQLGILLGWYWVAVSILTLETGLVVALHGERTNFWGMFFIPLILLIGVGVAASHEFGDN